MWGTLVPAAWDGGVADPYKHAHAPRVTRTRSSKKFDDTSIRLDTIPALDRQKCYNNIALCMHCTTTRAKN